MSAQFTGRIRIDRIPDGGPLECYTKALVGLEFNCHHQLCLVSASVLGDGYVEPATTDKLGYLVRHEHFLDVLWNKEMRAWVWWAKHNFLLKDLCFLFDREFATVLSGVGEGVYEKPADSRVRCV